MSNKKRVVDPIPAEFNSYEEAAEFWDTHDTTEYLDEFQTVIEFHSELRQRHYEVEIDADVLQAVKVRARKLGISTNQLASDLLRQQVMAGA